MRKPIIAGNWKMNKTVDEAVKMIEELKPLVKDAACDVVVCPTFVCLDAVKKAVAGSNIKVAAQNMHFEESGAFTGEVAPGMLEAMGIDYVVLEQREAGVTDDFIACQIKVDMAGLTNEQAAKVVIAYEPIWAIGTGKTATKEQANETISAIRKVVEGMYGKEVADAIRIQYGGSVKPNTIKDQMAMSDIDGALVGGASLAANDFAAIVNY